MLLILSTEGREEGRKGRRETGREGGRKCSELGSNVSIAHMIVFVDGRRVTLFKGVS